MLALDFRHNLNQLDLLKYEANELQRSELCYIRLPDDPKHLNVFYSYIKNVATITDNLWLSVPSIYLEMADVLTKLSGVGANKLSVRVTLSPTSREYAGIGSESSGDQEFLAQWKQFEELHAFQLAAELSTEGCPTNLAPTAVQLLKGKCPWLILDVPNSPTVAHVGYIQRIFEYLQLRGIDSKFVFFPFSLKSAPEWNVKTLNTFSGPKEVHIDVSNRCTHSCVFCGLYGPDAITLIKARGSGSIGQDMKKMMGMEIQSEKCKEIISSLPDTTDMIQFGGLGDPLMHPNMLEFIRLGRSRGFSVEILSNLEYLNAEDITQLHELGGSNDSDLHFYVNLSGATESTYLLTRPRQSSSTYRKVLDNISQLSRLRNKSKGRGVYFTLQCVVNSLNFHEAHLFPDLAHELGANAVFWKPIEIHGDVHRKLVPAPSQARDYAILLKKGMKRANELGIIVRHKDIMDATVRAYA